MVIDCKFDAETFFWALGSLCNLYRIPFDARLTSIQFPPPHTSSALLEALKATGFEASVKKQGFTTLLKQKLPLMVLLEPVSGDAYHRLALIVKAEPDRILYFCTGNNTPLLATEQDFASIYSGHAFEVTPLIKTVEDRDRVETSGKFGFTWFVPELLKHKKVWRDVLTASLVMQLIALVTPLCSQIIIDKVIVHHTESTLVVIAVALAMSILFTAGLTWIRQYLVSHTGNRVDAVLGTAVFRQLFNLPVRYFQHRATGVVAARLHGVETIREFVSGAAMTLLLDLPFLFIFLIIMMIYSVWLSVITLVIIAIIIVMSLIVAPMFQKKLNEQFLLGARNEAFITEYVGGMETVKSLQMEPQLTRKYEEYLATYLGAAFSTRQLSNTYNVIANTLEQGMNTAILVFGAWLVMTQADFTIGMLVAFQMFAGRVSQPMLRLVGLWQQFQQANISVRRLGDIMDAPAEPYSLTPNREGAGEGRVEFRNVSFRYGEDLPLLYQNLNLTILPGQCVGIMGPSGSGKSTLVKLLLGFYFPSEGQVFIDGKETRHLAANELRTHFGVVPQETTLFSGTLYDNLILANPYANFERMVQACKLAEIHDVIEALPQGYQTEIGERGVGLSGGQKQRIAIARALLKRPKILIFDEATSSLDQTTAEHFVKTINSLKGKVTMLFITHHMPPSLRTDAVVQVKTSVA